MANHLGMPHDYTDYSEWSRLLMYRCMVWVLSTREPEQSPPLSRGADAHRPCYLLPQEQLITKLLRMNAAGLYAVH